MKRQKLRTIGISGSILFLMSSTIGLQMVFGDPAEICGTGDHR